MDEKESLKKLNKEELIRIIDLYKEKLASMEEYTRVMKIDSRGF